MPETRNCVAVVAAMNRVDVAADGIRDLHRHRMDLCGNAKRRQRLGELLRKTAPPKWAGAGSCRRSAYRCAAFRRCLSIVPSRVVATRRDRVRDVACYSLCDYAPPSDGGPCRRFNVGATPSRAVPCLMVRAQAGPPDAIAAQRASRRVSFCESDSHKTRSLPVQSWL